MQVEEKSVVRQATPTTAVPAKMPRLCPTATLVATYWGVFFLVYWLELTTFARFASRVGAAMLFVLLFFAFWLFDRRTRFVDRLLWFAVVAGGAVIANQVSHASQAGFGMLLG